VTVSDEELRKGCELIWETEFRAAGEEFHRMKHLWFPHLVGSAPPLKPTTTVAPPRCERYEHGVPPGASAPEVLVEEIMGAFAERYILDIETVTATEEGVFFPLPRPLRDHEAAE